MKKIGPYVVIICGIVTFLASFFILQKQNLSQIKFSDLYSFVLGIFLVWFGANLLSKSKKDQKLKK